jgi:autotransporter-associated beta strand protein
VATVDGANTYTGTTKIEAGTVQLVEGGSFAAGSSLFLQSGAAMDLNGFSQTFSEIDGAAGSVSLGSGDLTVGGSGNSDFGGVISGSGKLIKSGLGTMTLSAAQSYSGGTEVTGGRLIGNTTSLTGAISNSATVEFSQESNGTLGASLNGSGALVKSGSGAMTITNAQNFTGGTSVNGGTLVVDGSVTGSTVTVNNGGTLSGSGSVGGIVVNLGGTIRPGNSPGTQPVVGNVVWNAGGNYDWEIYNAAPGGAGTTWDLISASGTLNLSALTVGSEFNINLWSLQSVGPDQNGEAINFNPNQSYTWTILTAAGGITGYTGTDQFIVNTAAFNGTGGFANDLAGGTFSVLQNGNNLNLVFTAAGGAAVPEPGTWAAAALLAGGAAFMRWRKRNKAS